MILLALEKNGRLTRQESLVLRGKLSGKPRLVSSKRLAQWYILPDASYEQAAQTGGLGGV